jgi:hypothetical protein
VSHKSKDNIEAANEKIVKELGDVVKSIKFGQLVITIHNSKIVQVDRTEKYRYQEANYFERGSRI